MFYFGIFSRIKGIHELKVTGEGVLRLLICDEVDRHALDGVFDLFCAVVDEVGQLFHFAAGLVLGGVQEFL